MPMFSVATGHKLCRLRRASAGSHRMRALLNDLTESTRLSCSAWRRSRPVEGPGITVRQSILGSRYLKHRVKEYGIHIRMFVPEKHETGSNDNDVLVERDEATMSIMFTCEKLRQAIQGRRTIAGQARALLGLPSCHENSGGRRR